MESKPTKPIAARGKKDRLKAALQVNLQRRKAQAKARDLGTDADVQQQENES